MLKGSLDAAENSKAAAEHQLQTVKSDVKDLEVWCNRNFIRKGAFTCPCLRVDHMCLVHRAATSPSTSCGPMLRLRWAPAVRSSATCSSHTNTSRYHARLLP